MLFSIRLIGIRREKIHPLEKTRISDRDALDALFLLIRMQGDLIHPPIQQLARIKFIFRSAIQGMHRAELLRSLAGFPELAHDGSVQFQFVNVTAVDEISREIAVYAVKVLVRTLGHA